MHFNFWPRKSAIIVKSEPISTDNKYYNDLGAKVEHDRDGGGQIGLLKGFQKT